jgi:hypothetical protein
MLPHLVSHTHAHTHTHVPLCLSRSLALSSPAAVVTFLIHPCARWVCVVSLWVHECSLQHRVDNLVSLSIPLEDVVNADAVAAYEEVQQQKKLKGEDVGAPLCTPGVSELLQPFFCSAQPLPQCLGPYGSLVVLLVDVGTAGCCLGGGACAARHSLREGPGAVPGI